MSDIRAQVLQSMSRQQRGVRIAVDDRFVRGTLLVTVTATDAGRVTWRETGASRSRSGTRAKFTERALTRLTPPPAQPGLTDLLASVWDIAGARGIDPRERFDLIRIVFPGVAAGRVGTDDEKALLRRWLNALMANTEPERT